MASPILSKSWSRSPTLLFLRRLDDLQTLEENKSARLRRPIERRVFPEGNDPRGKPYAQLRWSRFKHAEAREMFTVVGEHVFPFLRTLGGDDSTYAHHMKDARFTIPTPALLARVVDLLDARADGGPRHQGRHLRIHARQDRQRRAERPVPHPRHIIRLMVEMTAPQPTDVVCDPACGTCGLPGGGGRIPARASPGNLPRRQAARALPPRPVPRLRLRQHHAAHRQHEPAAARRGKPRHPSTATRSPRTTPGEDEKYTLVLANPPFAGSLDYENCARDLQQVVKTKKTELLFLALFLRLLKPGGRAAVIVPDGVLFGSSTAHKTLRKLLVEEQKLDAVISLPGGAFKPYAGVSTAILLFTKTNSGGTDHVWFYDVDADGWSLDDKRQPLLPEDKLGPVPAQPLSAEEHAKNNLPDVLARWQQRDDGENASARAPRRASACRRPTFAANGYDLSLNRYKEVVYEEVQHVPPKQILAELAELEREIEQGMKELEEMVR